MSRFPRKSLLATFALAAALAAPQALAQEASEQAGQTDTTNAQVGDPAGQQLPPDPEARGSDVSGSNADTTTRTTSEYRGDDADSVAGEPQQGTWADIDVDGDGNISRAEAAAVPALAQAFDDADGDTDDMLTAEEYRSYSERLQGEARDDQ
ncbi:MAG: hypothetical protein M3Q40_01475 [Pseudomonadota bacterium]|nr:hypothetical protein [Pseudomonadota bacterium]